MRKMQLFRLVPQVLFAIRATPCCLDPLRMPWRWVQPFAISILDTRNCVRKLDPHHALELVPPPHYVWSVPAPAREGRQGAEAAVVSRWTTVPIPRRKKYLSPVASHKYMKNKLQCTPGSTNRHTHLSLMAKPLNMESCLRLCPPPPPRPLFFWWLLISHAECPTFGSAEMSCN